MLGRTSAVEWTRDGAFFGYAASAARGHSPRLLGNMTRSTKSLCWALGTALAFCAVLFAFRWLGVFSLIAALIMIACSERFRTEEFCLLALAAFLFCSLLPVDVSFATRPGFPRLLPVCYGKPGKTVLDRAHRGEVVLGGCMVSGYDPLWVVVW